jgi:hypothetical protein
MTVRGDWRRPCEDAGGRGVKLSVPSGAACRRVSARRAEVGTIRIDDVDRQANKLHLQSTTIDNGQLFLSRGIRDYGQPLTDSAIRELFDRLRPALSRPGGNTQRRAHCAMLAPTNCRAASHRT